MRKGRDGGKKTGGKKKREKRKENTDENSGPYVIASSRPLERHTLVPIYEICSYLAGNMSSMTVQYRAVASLDLPWVVEDDHLGVEVRDPCSWFILRI